MGPDRRFAFVRASLADFKGIKDSLGGTVNDVVLTVVARALRRHLERRGEDVDDLELHAFVPISVRREDARGEAGNEVAGMIVPLPVSCEEPATCFRTITATTGAEKVSGQAIGAQALTELSGFAPPTILDQAARLAARQRLVNLVVTNVPGPQQPLELLGRELKELIPMVPLGGNLNLGVAVLSYNGRLVFGLVGDFDNVPDLDDLAGDFEQAIAELTEVAGLRATPGERLAPV